MLWLLFVILGAVAGFVFAPKISAGLDPKIGAAGGAVVGLIAGYILKAYFWTLILLALGAAAYWYYDNHVKK